MKKKLIIIIASIIAALTAIIVPIAVVNSNKKMDLTNTLKSNVFKYDGTPHSIYVTGDIPDGVTVSYKNNEQVEVGHYIVEAYLSDSSNKYNPLSLSAQLTILKGDLSTTLSDTTVPYDGKAHNVGVVGNIPDGVNVTYSQKDIVDVGSYDITVLFNDTLGRYNDLTLTAKLTILPKDTNVRYEASEFTYTGDEFEHKIKGDLPSDVTVSYSNNKATNAGTYQSVATFGGNYLNYGLPEKITSSFVIKKADLSGVVFNDSTITYDGSKHMIRVSNIDDFSENFIITYFTDNADQEGFVNAGAYVINLLITDKNNNYNDYSSSAKLTINKAKMTDNVVLHGNTFNYDEKPHSLLVSGLENNEIHVTYQNNEQTEIGTYEVYAQFSSLNYEVIDDLHATMIIQENIDKALSFENKTIAFDNENHEFKVSGKVPSWLKINYETPTTYKEVGEYVVTAKLEVIEEGHSVDDDTMSATLKIEYPFEYENQADQYTITSLKNYKNIYIPNSIQENTLYLKKINDNVFKNKDIESVKFDSSISGVSFNSVSFENDDKLLSVTLPTQLNKIPAQMFKNCTSLENIIIPQGVSEISTSAFEGCKNLTNITFPTEYKIGANAFKGCTKLNDLVLQGTITSISVDSFRDCNLNSLTLNGTCLNYSIVNNSIVDTITNTLLYATRSTTLDNIELIGEYAYSQVTLDTITLENVLLDKNAFNGVKANEVIIKDNVIELPEGVFNNTTIKKITVGKDVEDISYNAFIDTDIETFIVDSKNLKYRSLDANGLFDDKNNLVLGFRTTDTSKANKILQFAYFNNKFIETLDINSTYIEGGAVMRCDNLKVINIGTTTFDSKDASSNQGFPFAYNKNLETINVSPLNSFFESGKNALISKDNADGVIFKTLYNATKNYVIGDNIEFICDNAFSGLTLDTLSIPSSVIAFGEYAFDETTINTLYLSKYEDLTLIVSDSKAFSDLKVNIIEFNGTKDEFDELNAILGIDITNTVVNCL